MDKNELQLLYDQAGSSAALARQLGRPLTTMRNELLRAGVQLGRGTYHSPKKVRHYGPDHYNWKGGTTLLVKGGHIREYAPDHPAAKKSKGYVLQHRLVMERALGRYLEPGEVVHHINGDKQDNRLENLELVRSLSDHMKHHKRAASRDNRGRFLE
jgi:hypothetical protein